jgi:hypothetical protein
MASVVEHKGSGDAFCTDFQLYNWKFGFVRHFIFLCGFGPGFPDSAASACSVLWSTLIF